jgi:serine/threonine-protein kinase HipA
MTQMLDVYLHGILAGKLSQDDHGKLSFEYHPNYLKNPNSRPLSIAMPLQTQRYEDKMSQAFFEGLLPEETVRQRLAKNLQVSVGNTFKLLEVIGGECAGAIALYPEGKKPENSDDDFVILNDAELEEILVNLKQYPFLADHSNFRLSLAGAQDKLPVLIMQKDIAIPQKLPSSHILKIPINSPYLEINESVHNEFFCMQLARLLSISVPETEIRWCKKIPSISGVISPISTQVKSDLCRFSIFQS